MRMGSLFLLLLSFLVCSCDEPDVLGSYKLVSMNEGSKTVKYSSGGFFLFIGGYSSGEETFTRYRWIQEDENGCELKQMDIKEWDSTRVFFKESNERPSLRVLRVYQPSTHDVYTFSVPRGSIKRDVFKIEGVK